MDLSRYRPNVGVVLFNQAGQVWYGRRADTPPPHCWQFPQGGVDEGEDLYPAALRELQEETGVVSTRLLGRTQGWIIYDYPPEVFARRPHGFLGQKQVWFALEFTGDDAEIRLDQHAQIEFDAWRWGALGEAPGLIVPFKRAAYESVVATFAQYADR